MERYCLTGRGLNGVPAAWMVKGCTWSNPSMGYSVTVVVAVSQN